MPRPARRSSSASTGSRTSSRASDESSGGTIESAFSRLPAGVKYPRPPSQGEGTKMAPDEREEMPTIVPMVAYEDPATAIDWLVRAFGFRERKDQRMKDRDGRITHAELRLGEGRVFLATPTPDYQSPKHHRETCAAARKWSSVPWVVDGLLVHVDDVDRHSARSGSPRPRAGSARRRRGLPRRPHPRPCSRTDSAVSGSHRPRGPGVL